LQVGAPGREPVTHISPIFHNSHRVSHEKSKAKKQLLGSTRANDVYNLQNFLQENSAIVPFEDLSLGLLSIQTNFMRSVAAMDIEMPIRLDDPSQAGDPETPDPVGGFVTDAAHGFWKDKACMLIITLCYCYLMRRWHPVVISWATGQGHEHYRQHFLVLFDGLLREAKRLGLTLVDEWFANVCLSSCLIVATNCGDTIGC
jgi:hypothetical protein